MKKILIVLAIMNIVVGILGFFILLGINIIYALISLDGPQLSFNFTIRVLV